MRQVVASLTVLALVVVLGLGLEGIGVPQLLPALGQGSASAVAGQALTADPLGPSADPASDGDMALVTETATPIDELIEPRRCSHPGGFTIAYPADWTSDAGPASARCARFGPEDSLGRYTDSRRDATVQAVVNDVSFDEAVATDPGFGQATADTVVDGRRAVRLHGTDGDGRTFTRYLVDLTTTVSAPRTLSLDTVGVYGVDHDGGRFVLDLMARTVHVAAGSNQVDPATVTRYGSGDDEQAFTVLAESRNDVICLRLEQQVSESCAGSSATPTVQTLDGPRPVVAGLAPAGTFQVDLIGSDGSIRSVLPTPVTGSGEVSAWAAPEIGHTTSVVLYDVAGQELGSAQPLDVPTAG